MDFFGNLALGFSVALTPFNLLMAVVGVTLGILIGALPGVGPPLVSATASVRYSGTNASSHSRRAIPFTARTKKRSPPRR